MVAQAQVAIGLDEQILRTLIYADIFHFPLTEREIHHFLIGAKAAPDDIRLVLADSPLLQRHVHCVDGYFVLRGCEKDVAARQAHDRASDALLPAARQYGRLIAHLPFVRMVAITGALAMRNASHEYDDIDYLIVTKQGRVWLTRLLVVIIVRLAAFQKVALCPNYVVSEAALEQTRCDLFIAHELAQMMPMAGLALYRTMREINRWSDAWLPNAGDPFYAEPDATPQGIGLVLQRTAEVILNTPIGDMIERWEYQRKLRKFAPQTQQPTSSATIDGDQAKGHFNDHGLRILEQYEERLRAFGLADGE
jgi:hypothetical protein